MILVEVYITRLAVMFYRILKSFSDEGKYFPFTTFRLPDCPYETDTFFFTSPDLRALRAMEHAPARVVYW